MVVYTCVRRLPNSVFITSRRELLFLRTGSFLMESSVEIRRTKLPLQLFALVLVYMSLCVGRNVVEGIYALLRLYFTCHERDRHPDGRTDRQTDTAWRYRPRLCIASRVMFTKNTPFCICRAMLCISAAYADTRCLSVCPSVTFVYSVKTNKHIFKCFTQSGSHTI